MPRRTRSKNNIEVELFPFLSILACTIGTLILLIFAMTVQSFSSQREVTIIAKTEEGQNQTKTPRYIECRADGVVIYPSEAFVGISELASSSSAFQVLLEEVRRRREQEYLIVAVRPQGIEVFEEVRSLIRDRGIDIGYEPIDEGWKLKIKGTPGSQL